MSNLLLAELDDFYQGRPSSTIVPSSQDISRVPNQSSNNSNVEILFDATVDELLENHTKGNEQEEDEEFGDFETGNDDVRNHNTTTQSSGTITTEEVEGQLLDLGFEDSAPAAEFSDLNLSERQSQRPTHTNEPSSFQQHIHQKDEITQEEDDNNDWGDFVDSFHAPTTKLEPSTSPSDDTVPKPTDNNNVLQQQQQQQQPNNQPLPPHIPPPSTTTNPQPRPQPQILPTNIPPPSQLLPLFRPLLTSTPPSPKTNLPSTLLVLAHILSGRRLRWKRDVYLSSAHTLTSITSTTPKKGLKLHSLTSNEQQHEAREVAEILHLWRSNAGRLRGAKKLPEIREHMVVVAVGPEQGGIVSKRPCLLCGLLRQERVRGVHGFGAAGTGTGTGAGPGLVTVEDSFGEWWVEDLGWIGHVVCRVFWEERRGELGSR